MLSVSSSVIVPQNESVSNSVQLVVPQKRNVPAFRHSLANPDFRAEVHKKRKMCVPVGGGSRKSKATAKEKLMKAMDAYYNATGNIVFLGMGKQAAEVCDFVCLCVSELDN